MFKKGFDKIAFVLGGLVGAVAGGEKDKKGEKKNRHIGALRGAALEGGGTIAGASAVSHMAKRHAHALFDEDPRVARAALNKLKGAGLLGAVAGGAAGYGAMKAFGPKYDKDKKGK